MANPDELYEGILDRLLNAVPNDVDKREGSIIFNALAPVALELQEVYEELADVMKETFADTASLDSLILRARERGVEWMEATHSIVEAELTFTEEVNTEPAVIGSVFALENSSLMFAATERVSFDGAAGKYLLTCTDVGMIGNVANGSLIVEEAEDDALFEYLTEAKITALHKGARNDEDVEAFRTRYFDSINNEAFGGNVADYKDKALNLDTVSAVQVEPVWNGPGTVRLRFINGSYGVPSTSEVQEVQNAFDPTPNKGEGYGLAPIGHNVTVIPATAVDMVIVATATIGSAHSWQDLYDTIKAKCEEYLLSLRKEWQHSAVTVSPGVLSYLIKLSVSDINTFSCTINGHDADFVLKSDEVPVFKSLTEA